MLYRVNESGIELYAPLLRELVRREQERGDPIQLAPLVENLVSGQTFLLAVFAGPDYPIPILVMVCRESLDRVRDQRVLWVDHVLVPHSSEVRGQTEVIRADYAALRSRYPLIRFVTNNPQLVQFLNQIGIISQELFRIYELKAGT